MFMFIAAVIANSVK